MGGDMLWIGVASTEAYDMDLESDLNLELELNLEVRG
jgi:hypothetical protein